MKTAEEILGNFGIGVNIEFGRYKFLYETLKNMVEHTQKESYNQALDDALTSAVVETVIDEMGVHRIIHKDSILRLKK